MADQPTDSAPRVIPAFRKFVSGEVNWWVICCRLFEKKYAWRQVPQMVKLQDLENRPEPKSKRPDESSLTGDPTEFRTFLSRQQVWMEEQLDRQRQDLLLSQSYDLTPVPELSPWDSRPPEQRDWASVRGYETKLVTERKYERVATLTRSRRELDKYNSQETVTEGSTFRPVESQRLQERLKTESLIHLPETIVMVIPGRNFQSFLETIERGALSIVRCRWDRQLQATVPTSSIPVTFFQPGVELVCSVALETLGVLPITHFEGVPKLPFLPEGHQVPTTRAESEKLESWIDTLGGKLPRWYSAPEYRSLVALNLAVSEAVNQWGGADYFWRPLIDAQDAQELSEALPEDPLETY